MFVVGIDPWDDRTGDYPHIDYLTQNARSWRVEDRVLGIKVGVPDTGFADASFDSVYCTTTLEIIRGFEEEGQYSQCLAEILRILRLVGLLGLAEPMRLDVDLPEGLAPLVSKGPASFADYLVIRTQWPSAVR